MAPAGSCLTSSLFIAVFLVGQVDPSHYRKDQAQDLYEEDDIYRYIEPPIAQPLNYRLPVIPTSAPKFLATGNLTIMATQGTTVMLPCSVQNLGSENIFWIRRPELTVLSIGAMLFSTSPRLSVQHAAGSQDWNLQVNSVQPEDSGLYECQVNTEPRLSRWVELRVFPLASGSPSEVSSSEGSVISPRAGLMVSPLALSSSLHTDQADVASLSQRTEILSPPSLKVEEGGSVTLECVVTEHQQPPTYFTWFIEEKPLDFHIHRGGILLQEERKIRSSASKLTITKMELGDSGGYTCTPQGADSATVEVVVVPLHEHRLFFTDGSSTSHHNFFGSFCMLLISFYVTCMFI